MAEGDGKQLGLEETCGSFSSGGLEKGEFTVPEMVATIEPGRCSTDSTTFARCAPDAAAAATRAPAAITASWYLRGSA